MARRHIILPLHIWNLEGLSVTERLVASVIHGYTEQGKPCFMTNTGFSKLLHVSKRTASAAVNTLIDEGYVEPLEDGKRRSLRWKNLLGGVADSARGGRSQLLGGVAKTSIRNTEHIDKSITEHNMNEGMREEERKPIHWQQVRDYFKHINTKERTRHQGHCEAWAKDFYTYYDSREWQNKHGAITKWRPVALAWYRRNAEKVPHRPVPTFDAEKARADIRWHRRRYEMYERQDKGEQAHRELNAIARLQQQLKQNGHALDA